MAVKRDIFKPGQSYYGNINDSGLYPGDVVMLSAGQYGDFDFQAGRGVTFVAEGLVEMQSFNLRVDCLDCSLIGNQFPNTKYGVRILSKTRFGLYVAGGGVMEFHGIHVDGCPTGWQVLSDPGETRFTKQKITCSDILIENTSNEGIYWGKHIPGGPLIHLEGRNIIIRNCGADGLQLRNAAYFRLENVLIENVGQSGDSGHAQGLNLGTGTNGGYIKNIQIKNASGNPVFLNGFGDFTIENLGITGGNNWPVFTKNYEAQTQDTQRVGFQKLTIKNSVIDSASEFMGVHYNNPDQNCPVTVTYENVRANGNVYLQPGVTLNKVNVGPSVVIDKPVDPPPPPPVEPVAPKEIFKKGYFTISGKRFYYIMYKDKTWVETNSKYAPL
jgi:hypothetical protein